MTGLGRALGLVLAAVLVVVGGLWTLQGLGYVDGGFTSDSPTWATIGPIVAGFGVALGFVVVRPRQ